MFTYSIIQDKGVESMQWCLSGPTFQMCSPVACCIFFGNSFLLIDSWISKSYRGFQRDGVHSCHMTWWWSGWSLPNWALEPCPSKMTAAEHFHKTLLQRLRERSQTSSCLCPARGSRPLFLGEVADELSLFEHKDGNDPLSMPTPAHHSVIEHQRCTLTALQHIPSLSSRSNTNRCRWHLECNGR
jgi:hypothetical protein